MLTIILVFAPLTSLTEKDFVKLFQGNEGRL